MSRSALHLLAVSAACVILGEAALVAAWSNPDSDLASVLASAAGWPWLLAALLGARVWYRGKGRSSEPLEHFLATYAAGTGAAILAGAAILIVAGWEFPVLPCPSFPFESLCAILAAMAVAAVFAGITLGLVFPALLPIAAAAVSAVALTRRPPSRRHLAAGIAAAAAGWLLAAAGGLVLAHA